MANGDHINKFGRFGRKIARLGVNGNLSIQQGIFIPPLILGMFK